MLQSAFCQWCEQEFFYPPAKIGQGLAKERRPRKRRTCDLCRTDEKRIRRIKKFGPQAADDVPLSPQEQAKDDYKWYVLKSLQVSQPKPWYGTMENPYDAAYECRHGSLPLDTKIDCDCWKGAREAE